MPRAVLCVKIIRPSTHMVVTVRGGPLQLRQEIRRAARWMAASIMSHQLIPNLQLAIVLSPTLKKRERCYGYCNWLDKNHRPRNFEIYIDIVAQNKHKQFLTLAHELVHVKQFATGELFDYAANQHIRWKKRTINPQNINYYKLPWEKEAYIVQKTILTGWNKSKNHEN